MRRSDRSVEGKKRKAGAADRPDKRPAPVPLRPFTAATPFTGEHSAGQCSAAALPQRWVTQGPNTGFTALARLVAEQASAPQNASSKALPDPSCDLRFLHRQHGEMGTLPPPDAAVAAVGCGKAGQKGRRVQGGSQGAQLKAITPPPVQGALNDFLALPSMEHASGTASGVAFGTLVLDHARDINPCIVALARQTKRPMVVAVTTAERATVVVEYICKQPDLPFPVTAVDGEHLGALTEDRSILVVPADLLPRLAAMSIAFRMLIVYDVPQTAAQYVRLVEESGVQVVVAFTTPGREGTRVAHLLRELHCVHGIRHATLANPLDG
eukprot:GGOE01043832.1.p1 GENE.GGOE01043832.1~~GGOE01043832.1.p1  ORF type:complete len:325 (-),score=79.15 GGOE01043832.1:294-1268(-)